MRSESEIADIAERALNIAADCMANNCGCLSAQVGMNLFAYLAWVLEWDNEYVGDCVRGAINFYREEAKDAARRGSQSD